MKRANLNFVVSQQNWVNLQKLKEEKIWSLSKSAQFIFDSYLENPEGFNFSVLKNFGINTGNQKKIPVNISIDKETKDKLQAIAEENMYNFSMFLRKILDKYFVKHPEYCNNDPIFLQTAGRVLRPNNPGTDSIKLSDMPDNFITIYEDFKNQGVPAEHAASMAINDLITTAERDKEQEVVERYESQPESTGGSDQDDMVADINNPESGGTDSSELI